jgi:hypothetical protein
VQSEVVQTFEWDHGIESRAIFRHLVALGLDEKEDQTAPWAYNTPLRGALVSLVGLFALLFDELELAVHLQVYYRTVVFVERFSNRGNRPFNLVDVKVVLVNVFKNSLEAAFLGLDLPSPVS